MRLLPARLRLDQSVEDDLYHTPFVHETIIEMIYRENFLQGISNMWL